ncbi:MAG: hypothetical protein HY011_19000 [Acidobacteria bacterium]|nr:hypothetical protein [Acidobacteriota bacterium]
MAQPCKICGHAERAGIEDALHDGVSLRVTARQFGVSKDGLNRHRLAHSTAVENHSRAAIPCWPPHYGAVLGYWNQPGRFLAWRGTLLAHCPQVSAAELTAILAHAVRAGELRDGGAFHTATAALKARFASSPTKCQQRVTGKCQ